MASALVEQGRQRLEWIRSRRASLRRTASSLPAGPLPGVESASPSTSIPGRQSCSKSRRGRCRDRGPLVTTVNAGRHGRGAAQQGRLSCSAAVTRHQSNIRRMCQGGAWGRDVVLRGADFYRQVDERHQEFIIESDRGD
jgi:hypothetical protein